jgi:hypothetical protein
MNDGLPTAELPTGASFLLIHGQNILEGAKVSQAALPEAKDIALAEMARRRGRLGTLTREQEIGLEDLLMSTVTRISELVGRVPEPSATLP